MNLNLRAKRGQARTDEDVRQQELALVERHSFRFAHVRLQRRRLRRIVGAVARLYNTAPTFPQVCPEPVLVSRSSFDIEMAAKGRVCFARLLCEIDPASKLPLARELHHEAVLLVRVDILGIKRARPCGNERLFLRS